MEQIDIFQNGNSVSRVVCGEGMSLKSDLGECFKPYERIYVVADRQVVLKSRIVYDLVQDFSIEGVPVKLLDVSEALKTMDAVLDICSWLLEQGADRDALVVAVGGGIMTDMTGFAASIYKRGVKYANIPTTLLAQVDAALGGKTGVNHEKYKNILGVISQPEFTYLCPQVLESLPRRDFLSGVAELLKTFIIDDGGLYEKAVSYMTAYAEDSAATLAQRQKELGELIRAAAAVKAGVVSRDQFEKGERRVLNLGHTFAHAIETLTQRDEPDVDLPVLVLARNMSKVTHGEAVAMGIVMAARLSDRLKRSQEGIFSKLAGAFKGDENGLAAKIEKDFRSCGLPVSCPYTINEMAEAMAKDKKAEKGKVHFVVPREIGKVEIVDLSVDEVVKFLK